MTGLGLRILFLSNFYPPYSQGGYEQLCQEVAHLLADRGHNLCVLTGRAKGVSSVEEDGPVSVHRCLELELEGGLGHTVTRLAFGGREASERRNIATVERAIDDFRPDVALIWGMWNVPRVVPATVERLLPTAYYLCDYWPALPNAYIQRLQAPARGVLGRWAKRLLSTTLLRWAAEPLPSLAFRHMACVSEAMRELIDAHGIELPQSTIIRNGISLEDFARLPDERLQPMTPLRLVYAGRITPDKGIETAIDALALVEERSSGAAHLTVYGEGNSDYLRILRERVRGESLPITFHGFVLREMMPAMLAKESALILPSIVAEALPRIVLEAMAAGLVVIGTTTGGTGEVLVEGETGLTFRAGDAADLARQIARLADDPLLRERLAAAGQALVLREFDIRSTVDQLESLLYRASTASERQLT